MLLEHYVFLCVVYHTRYITSAFKFSCFFNFIIASLAYNANYASSPHLAPNPQLSPIPNDITMQCINPGIGQGLFMFLSQLFTLFYFIYVLKLAHNVCIYGTQDQLIVFNVHYFDCTANYRLISTVSGYMSALHGNQHSRLAVSQSPSPVAPGVTVAAPSSVHQQQPQPQINLQLQPLSIVSDYSDLGNSMPVHKRFRVSAPSESEANANWS